MIMTGCGTVHDPPAATTSKPAPAAPPTPAPRAPKEDPPPPPPAAVEKIRVPGDLAASVVRGFEGPPRTVFLPGLCSNANAYLQGFPEAARMQGGVVAIEGDQPCQGAEGFRSFSWDAVKQHARIEAALAAAGLKEIPPEGLTIVGYSQGASIAEQLAQRWPARYARVVLIGSPGDPSAQRLAEARAVVTMSCSRDVPWRMKEAARHVGAAGVPATYFEMPDCTHGNLADGERAFDVTFTWLRANARPAPQGAVAVPITGAIEG
jgi:pimeloyl-ACP methyl ester carboxylesterase